MILMLMAMLMILYNEITGNVYDTLKIGQAANIRLGDTVLSVTQTYRYLGHIITNNLSDEADRRRRRRNFIRQWHSNSRCSLAQ